MKVRLTQLDGKLPNLALMKLAHFHRSRGDEVFLARTPSSSMFEPAYDAVYGSAIFSWTEPVAQRLLLAYPEATVGGTGTISLATAEEVIGSEYEHYDYSLYPDYPYSLGFTQLGCRLRCGFCVVPMKEGAVRAVNSISDIWRPNTPRCVLLLGNDFFGQDQWPDRFRLGQFHPGVFAHFNIGGNNSARIPSMPNSNPHHDWLTD